MTLAGGKVLVSGAGFAGLATAYWLNRLGYQVTVIEVASALRRGGTPVDIEGDTIGILARMGLIDGIRAQALLSRDFELKDANDVTVGAMPADAVGGGERFEIHRDDLLDILFAAVDDSVELVFGRTITQLEDGLHGVTATFDDGSVREYALVFGCDGSRSNSRRLAFNNEKTFSHFMGCYFAIKVMPNTGLLPANMSQVFSIPGRTALLNGYNDRTDIVFAFRSNIEIDYDYSNRGQQRRLIHDHFDGIGWKVPAMLDRLDADDLLYFDKVHQIRMPTWSIGRIALVGDAGYCLSPMAGMGGSMAIIGAAGLADALARHDTDHKAAFQEYHDNLHAFVNAAQEKAASVGMAMMFPADEIGTVE